MKQKKSSWMSALFAYAKNAKGELGLSVVLSVVSILLGLVPFFCMYRVVCLFAAGTAAKAAVISWCAWSLAAYAGKVLCFTLSTGISHHAAYNILEGLRLRLVERFLHAPLGKVQKHSIGEIKSILVDKIENIEPPLAHMIPEGAGHIVLPVVSFIALFAIDWRLALAALVTFPVALVCMMLTFVISGKSFQIYDESNAAMNSAIVEYIEGIEVIKAFGRAGVSYEKYAKSITDFRTFVVKWLSSTWVTMKLAFALFPSTLIGTLPVSLWLAGKGSISAPQAALAVMLAAYTIGLLLQSAMDGTPFDTGWVWKSLILLLVLVFFRFLFDYLRARFQEAISYELVARDRLAVGDARKRVSLGYFQQVSTGNILNSLTTGLGTLEGMGIRMIDNFVGGYLNFAVVFLSLLVFSLRTAVIALAAAAVSLVFLLAISHYSARNAPVEAQANRDMTGAILEYARGLAVVKSFGKDAAALDTIRQSIADSRNIHLKIEWGYLPSNALHLLALKCGSVGLALSACLSGLNGQMELPVVLTFVFFSFSIFASLEPISDSAHVLSVIDDAMDQLDKLRENHFIDSDGKDIPLQHFDIAFDHVDFGYDSRQVLHDVSFTIPEHTSTAIVGPSGSGKTTICSLLARFYDPDSGSISVGGHDIRQLTCDSLLSNISMVFQNVYLFHDTIRANICFGKPDATEEEMIAAAKKACCHEFIMALPQGYDTVIGEGGGTLSGGEKQRISIARAMLKDAPIIILDEATANVDPENEDRLQKAIEALTRDKTIIMIAHRLKTVCHADQILVVDHGRIVQQGTHEQLIGQPGIYAAFVGGRKQAEGWKL